MPLVLCPLAEEMRHDFLKEKARGTLDIAECKRRIEGEAIDEEISREERHDLYQLLRSLDERN